MTPRDEWFRLGSNEMNIGARAAASLSLARKKKCRSMAYVGVMTVPVLMVEIVVV